jgi:ankyrin repeat protein
MQNDVNMVNVITIIAVIISRSTSDMICYQDNYYQYTALHYACQVVNWLKHVAIDALLQPNPLLMNWISPYNGRTPLHLLSLPQHHSDHFALFPYGYIMKRYFHGSYPNKRDHHGQTPLHLLCLSLNLDQTHETNRIIMIQIKPILMMMMILILMKHFRISS